MSNVKVRLKNAREAIDKKDYEKALSECTIALNFEPENYHAMVFLAVAQQNLEQSDKATETLYKAIALNPSSPIAHQGLISVLTKIGDNEALASALRNYQTAMMEIKDSKKVWDATSRLLQLHESNKMQTYDILSSIVTELWPLLKDVSELTEISIFERMAELQEEFDRQEIIKEVNDGRRRLNALPLVELRQQVRLQVAQKSKRPFIYSKLRELGNRKVNENYLELLMDMMASEQSQEYQELAKTLLLEIQKDSIPTDLGYSVSIDLINESLYQISEETLSKYQSLLSLESPWALVSTVFSQWKNGQVNEEELKKLENDETLGESIFVSCLLATIHAERNEYSLSFQWSNKSLLLLQKMEKIFGIALQQTKDYVSLIRADALYHHSDLNDCKDEVKKIMNDIILRNPSNSLALHKFGLFLMAIGNYDMACQKIKLSLDFSPTNALLSDYGWCLFLSGNSEEAQKILLQLFSVSPDSLTHYRLGRIYFSQSEGRKNRSLAYTSFLKSVQLNTQFAPGFEYLGKYYLEVDLDLNRAIKCFEKAFSLDKKLFESIESMIEAYLRLERVQSAIQVLKQYLEIFPRHAWSWTKLGFLYLAKKQYQDAVVAFQFALKVNYKNEKTWEGLAEAYFYEGRYIAALKSFDRAIALAPEKKSLNYGKGLVYHRLREYQLAIEQFELSGQDCTLKNVGLKSKCDCLLDYSNHLFANGYFARSMDILNQSLATCLQILKNNCQTAKVFKLLSIIYHTAFLRQSLWSLLDQTTFKEASMDLFGVSLTQFSSLLLQTAKLSLEKCLSLTMALGIDPNSSSLWNDLAIINFYLYLETKDPNDHQKSMGYLFHGLRQDSQNPDIWKTMGIINLSTDPKISQHSLIKAVELDSKDALAWAYLGFLYSESNEWELADKAFVQSTIVDAECLLAWLGHALLKERQGDQEGCIKLLEHVHDLSLGTMALGNVELLYRLLNKLKRDLSEADQLSNFLFAAIKGAEYFPSQAFSLTLLGCIHEWDKDYEKANDAFEKALNVSTESNVRSMALLNRGRALCSVGEFEKSLAVFEQYLNQGGEATFSVLATMGIVNYFLGDLEKSLTLFQSCLENGQQETYSLVGRFVAQVLYALGTSEHQILARQQTLQIIEKNPKDIKALLLLCSIGLMEEDLSLAQSTIVELMSFLPNEVSDYAEDIHLILSAFFSIQGHEKASITIMAKLVHQYPANARYWSLLIDQILCGSSSIDVNDAHLCQSIESAISESEKAHALITQAYSLISVGEFKKALVAARKSIHFQPQNEEAWIALAVGTRSQQSQSYAYGLSVSMSELTEILDSAKQLSKRAESLVLIDILQVESLILSMMMDLIPRTHFDELMSRLDKLGDCHGITWLYITKEIVKGRLLFVFDKMPEGMELLQQLYDQTELHFILEELGYQMEKTGQTNLAQHFYQQWTEKHPSGAPRLTKLHVLQNDNDSAAQSQKQMTLDMDLVAKLLQVASFHRRGNTERSKKIFSGLMEKYSMDPMIQKLAHIYG